MPSRRRLATLLVLSATPLLLLAPAGAAAATTTGTSTNWAGYAVSGATYRTVRGSWTVPEVDCSATPDGSTASWIGLGGFDEDSKALEQIGTESDCVNGTARSSAWYELVPDASHDLALTVSPGDRMTSRVTVRGHRVVLRLTNATTGKTVRKRLRAATVDRSSAEWVLEAPSLCTTDGSRCEVTDLADFGTSGFTGAHATTAAGRTGTPGDGRWTTTAITLASETTRRSPGAASATATPSALGPDGASFFLTYAAGDTSVPARPVSPGATGGPA